MTETHKRHLSIPLNRENADVNGDEYGSQCHKLIYSDENRYIIDFEREVDYLECHEMYEDLWSEYLDVNPKHIDSGWCLEADSYLDLPSYEYCLTECFMDDDSTQTVPCNYVARDCAAVDEIDDKWGPNIIRGSGEAASDNSPTFSAPVAGCGAETEEGSSETEEEGLLDADEEEAAQQVPVIADTPADDSGYEVFDSQPTSSYSNEPVRVVASCHNSLDHIVPSWNIEE